MNGPKLCMLTAALCVCLGAATDSTQAQCTTCATPTVAYSPVVAQHAVVAQPVATVEYQPSNRWYPGRFFDRMRLRRAGFDDAPTTLAPVVTPQPTLAAYAPLGTRTTVARPVYASYYAPAATTVARPVYTSYYAPAVTTVQRQVVLSPIVTSACVTCGVSPCSCNPCGCDPCGCGASSVCSGCSSCGVATTSFADTGCASCSGGTSGPVYSTPAPSSGPSPASPNIGPQTPQPQLQTQPQVPQGESAFQSFKPEGEPDATTNENGASETPDQPVFPGPGPSEEEASTYLDPPQLFNPKDVTASRSMSTSVWTAVYRKPVTGTVSTQQPVSRSQAEIDAEGWSSVPR